MQLNGEAGKKRFTKIRENARLIIKCQIDKFCMDHIFPLEDKDNGNLSDLIL